MPNNARTLLTAVVASLFISLTVVECDAQRQRRLLGRRGNTDSGTESPYPGYGWELKPLVSARPPAAPRLPVASAIQPDLIIYAEPSRILSRMYRRTRELTPVNDNILETNIHGVAMNTTSTAPKLLPSDRGIEVELFLKTHARSETIGTNQAATARSHGITNVVGSKKILLTPASFQTTKARTLAQTNSDIIDFHWGRRIGQNVARQKADDQTSTIEYISASKASARASRQFDTTVDQSVRQLQRQFREQMRQLKSQNRSPQQLRLRSTHDQIIAEARFGTDPYATSGSALPPAPAILARDQAVVQAHESLVNQMIQQQIQQQDFDELQEDDWSEQMSDFLPVSTDALKVADEDRKWTLKMAEESPFDMRLENGQVSITMNVKNFTVGKRDYPGMKIEAKYAIEIGDSHVSAARTDKLKLTPTDEESKTDASGKKKRVGVRQQIFRSMVRKRFNPIFAETVDASRLLDQIPRQLGQSAVQLTNLEYSNGWFTSTMQLTNQ